MEKLLISACLVGENCKYNGGNNALPSETLAALRSRFELVPVCPEPLGGPPPPRVPSERRGARVVNREGADVTEAFRRGAEQALRIAEQTGCRRALLKSNSPSCGSGSIYDGSFSGRLTAGDGVAAALLKHSGIEVFGSVQGLF